MFKQTLISSSALLIFILLFSVGCSPNTDECHSSGKLSIYATIPPIANLIKKIGGDFVDVKVLINSGQDPHLFQPTPSQMVKLNKSTDYFTIGMAIEKRLSSKLTNFTSISFFDITTGINKRGLGSTSCHHEHDSDDECSSKNDPHLWLGNSQLIGLVDNIQAQLSVRDPVNSVTFEENSKALKIEVNLIHQQIKSMLAPFKGRSIMVFHPSFGYFTDTYGLIQMAIEFEGKTPTPKQFTHLVRQSQENGIKVLFIQPQFNQATGVAIAKSVGAKIVTLDSLSADINSNLIEIAKKIKDSM